MTMQSQPIDVTFEPMSVTVESTASQSVVFRSTQKLRSRDGYEIYFYSNRKCDGYNDSGRLMFSTTYRVANGEVFLLDENGRTVYKGRYRMKSDGRNLSSVTIAGTTYYAVN